MKEARMLKLWGGAELHTPCMLLILTNYVLMQVCCCTIVVREVGNLATGNSSCRAPHSPEAAELHMGDAAHMR